MILHPKNETFDHLGQASRQVMLTPAAYGDRSKRWDSSLNTINEGK